MGEGVLAEKEGGLRTRRDRERKKERGREREGKVCKNGPSHGDSEAEAAV